MKNKPSEKIVERRIAVVGAKGVGKTSLIQSFSYEMKVKSKDEQVDEYQVDLYYNDNNVIYSLLISDPQHDQGEIDQYVKNFDAQIFVFAYDDEESFNKVQEIFEEMIARRVPMLPRVVVGNKSNMQPFAMNVDGHEAHNYVRTRMRCEYFDCNVTDEQSVDDVFYTIIDLIEEYQE